MQINSGAQFGVLEREAVGPPRRAGEFIEERDVVGAFQRQAHHFVDLVSIWPDHNAPSIALTPLRMIVAACAARSRRRAGVQHSAERGV
jgi:hypothetical protein